MKTNKFLFLSVFFIFLLTILILSSSKNYLILTNANNGEILFKVPVPKNREFTIRWTHSVELTPWEEIFRIDEENNIILDRTRFKSFGAGVPDYAGDKATLDDGYVLYSNINKKMPNLVYGISGIAKHTLIIENDVYKLYEFIPADLGVKFSVKKLNIFQ